MTEPFYVTQARADLAEHCPTGIDAVLLVHPASRRKKVFGRKELASRLHINNYLVLTPERVALFGLGGRTGMKLKDELGSWPRSSVRATAERAERSSYFASTGSSLEYRTFCLHLTGPGLDLSVDVRADAGLFTDDLDMVESHHDDPEIEADMAEMRAEAAATAGLVDAFVGALTAA